MATTKIGDIELDTSELAQIGKSAFELLGPAARVHDVPNLANTKTEQAAIDRDFAEMAHAVIAAWMARGGALPKPKAKEKT